VSGKSSTSTSGSRRSPKMRVTAPRHELNRLRAVSGNNFSFDIKQARADSKNKRNVQQAVRGNSSTSTSGSRSSLKMKVTAPQHELNQNTSNSTSGSRRSPKNESNCTSTWVKSLNSCQWKEFLLRHQTRTCRVRKYKQLHSNTCKFAHPEKVFTSTSISKHLKSQNTISCTSTSVKLLTSFLQKNLLWH